MPITVAWDNAARTIVRIERTTPWDWSDFDRGVDDSYASIRSVDHIVYTINIISADEKFPQGRPMPHINRIVRQRPQYAGPTYIVGPQDPQRSFSFGSVIFSAARKAKKKVADTLRYVGSLDETYAAFAELQRAEATWETEEESN